MSFPLGSEIPLQTDAASMKSSKAHPGPRSDGRVAQSHPNATRFTVLIGRIVENYPLQNSCIVLVGFDSPVQCTYPTTGFSATTGHSTVFSPQIGDFVIVAKSYEANSGFILGSAILPTKALPGSKIILPIYGDYAKSFNELIDAHTFDSESIVFDTSNTSVADDFLSGEQASFGEYHVGNISGKLFHRLQAGVLASITLNKLDDMIDVVGHNFQLMNSAFKIRSFCDYGRTNTEILTSPILGPFVTDQDANHTIKLISGWFASGVAIQANQTSSVGKLYSDVWSDELGIVSIKSQVAGWISKNNGIYIPIKNFESDDPTGKGDKNISGVVPRLGFNIVPEGQDPAAFICQARDYVAWQTAGAYRFVRYSGYTKDWTNPKPIAQIIPPLNASSQRYGLGEIINIKSNQPTGKSENTNQDVNQTRVGDAHCGILPDGSVLLRSAWGDSVELTASGVRITSSKDVEVVSGRRTVILSGDDTIVRSQGATELTSTNGTVRIRGGRNILVDSRNGAIQLTALNSPAPQVDKSGDSYQPSGIILKSNIQAVLNAPSVSMVAKNFFSVLGEDDTTAPLIILKSSTQLNWTRGGHYLYTGEELGDPEQMVMVDGGNLQAAGMGIFGGQVYAKGQITTEGDLVGLGELAVNGPVVSATTKDGKVQTLQEPMTADPSAAKNEQAFESAVQDVTQQQYIDDARAPLDTSDYSQLEFTYRTTKEYKTTGYSWFETFWQRQYNDLLVQWKGLSQDVDVDGEMPYPGKDLLTGGSALVTYTEKNVNPDGTPKTPTEQSQTGGNFTKVPLSQMKFHP